MVITLLWKVNYTCAKKNLMEQLEHKHSLAVDMVGIQERAALFATRSIKAKSKLQALHACVQMIDLTTLEGSDTHGKVRQLCGKARNPFPQACAMDMDSEGASSERASSERASSERAPSVMVPSVMVPSVMVPPVAAVCVYPSLVAQARKYLENSSVAVASVATSFPSGQAPLSIKLQDVEYAVGAGAQEIDMVIHRGDFLSGEYNKVRDEIAATKEICGKDVHLKVILEVGELGTYDKIHLASHIAMDAGADFIKTSTGKIPSAASMPVTLVMLLAIRDHYERTGKKIGMKPAGGIRTAKQALHYLCMVKETLGPQWLSPSLFRFGASSLLNDLLKQIYKQKTGRYYYGKAFSSD